MKFLLACQNSDGAICEFPGGKPYPEVTGYSIPTLLHYGLREEAERCKDWLKAIQSPEGWYTGLEGYIPRTFDTAAVIEGLRKFDDTREHVRRAEDWLEKQTTEHGYIVTPSKSDTNLELYNVRVMAIMGTKKYLHHWRYENGWGPAWQTSERTHYIAYALEGFWRLGYTQPVIDFLKDHQNLFHNGTLLPYWLSLGSDASGVCVVATAQFSLLHSWVGERETARTLLNTVSKIPLSMSWEAKWSLDASALLS